MTYVAQGNCQLDFRPRRDAVERIKSATGPVHFVD
jgi:hypothetical protein